MSAMRSFVTLAFATLLAFVVGCGDSTVPYGFVPNTDDTVTPDQHDGIVVDFTPQFVDEDGVILDVTGTYSLWRDGSEVVTDHDVNDPNEVDCGDYDIEAYLDVATIPRMAIEIGADTETEIVVELPAEIDNWPSPLDEPDPHACDALAGTAGDWYVLEVNGTQIALPREDRLMTVTLTPTLNPDDTSTCTLSGDGPGSQLGSLVMTGTELPLTYLDEAYPDYPFSLNVDGGNLFVDTGLDGSLHYRYTRPW